MMAVEQVKPSYPWQKSEQNEQINALFSAATDSYDGAARLQRLTGKQLFELHSHKLIGEVLDLGCGTGINTKRLINEQTHITACDISTQMLDKTRVTTQGQCRYIQADARNLGFEAQSFDGIYSNLMVQWLDDLPATLKQLHNSLKDNGTLCVATLTEGTLHELANAWLAIDDDVHVNQFLTIDVIAEQFEQSGFVVELNTQTVRLDYPQVTDLARELKHLGANHVKNRRNKGLMGRGKWQKLAKQYDRLRQDNGMLPASYQVAYITATKRI